MPLTEEQKIENKINRKFEAFKCLQLSTVKNQVLREFQKLRRLQTSRFGEWECISCQKFVNAGDVDAGHFVSRKHTATAFDPKNCWSQCKYCNRHLNGNLDSYRRNLIEVIGLHEVRRLEITKTVDITYHRHDYAAMYVSYQQEINKLKGKS